MKDRPLRGTTPFPPHPHMSHHPDCSFSGSLGSLATGIMPQGRNRLGQAQVHWGHQEGRW